MSIADSVNIFLLAAACTGLFLNYLQLKSGEKIQRAIFLKDLYLQMRNDPKITEIYYKIEYGIQIADIIHGSEYENSVDQMLSIVNLICSLRMRNIFTKNEMYFFDYQFKKIYNNQEIRQYIDTINKISHLETDDQQVFNEFQKYAEKFLGNRPRQVHFPSHSHDPLEKKP